MSWRAVCQGVCLALFVALVALAGQWPQALRFVLRLDPGVALTESIMGLGLAALWPALALLALTAVFGRFFCGYACPLGTSLDLTGWLIRPRGRRAPRSNAYALPSGFKYGLLAALAVGIVAGLPLWGLFLPLPVADRLYAQIVLPVAQTLAGWGARPLAALGLHLPLPPEPRHFAWQGAALASIGLVLTTAWAFFPRWWCRHLCPSGAIFGLAARLAPWRRRVGSECNACQACVAACPAGAIAEDGQPLAGECLDCLECRARCPKGAIRFGMAFPEDFGAATLPGRRQLLVGGAAALGLSVLTRTGLVESSSPLDSGGHPFAGDLIRPPASLEEPDFVQACVRCGACWQACPTGMLQPSFLTAGISGLFTPLATPRRGPCQPECVNCGHVCPTGAIRRVDAPQKMWAKMGTARVHRQRCLAWEHNRSCLVCDEVCPYGAISLKKLPGQTVGVPLVDTTRCAGCGFCERHCPVMGLVAITVEPAGAIRLNEGDFEQAGRAQGLNISRENKKEKKLEDAGEEGGSGAPGFEP